MDIKLSHIPIMHNDQMDDTRQITWDNDTIVNYEGLPNSIPTRNALTFCKDGRWCHTGPFIKNMIIWYFSLNTINNIFISQIPTEKRWFLFALLTLQWLWFDRPIQSKIWSYVRLLSNSETKNLDCLKHATIWWQTEITISFNMSPKSF